MLALLLLAANRVVSRDRLIEELWPDHEPGPADHALRLQISRLRKVLGAERLLTQAPGYLLRVDPGELDLQRFEELTAAARRALDAGDLALAVATWRDADSLWRGRPLADLEFEEFVRGDAERLAELRLGAVEERIDVELALGRTTTVIPELEQLVAEHPLRERFRAQLMRALYAAGRQAEALAVYSATRKLLVDELGIEPGAELRELERRVLTQDPSLLARSGLECARPPRPAAGRAGRHPGSLAAAGAAAVVVAGVTTAALLLSAGGASTQHRARALESAGWVAFVDARSGKPIGSVATGPGAGFMRAGEGAVWKMEESGILFQFDRRSLRLVRSIPTGVPDPAIAVGEGAVWAAGRSHVLVRIDPRYGTIRERIRLPRRGLARPRANGGVAVGAGSVWVAEGQSRVVRIEPATGRVLHTFRVPGADVLAFGDDALWVASSELGRLTRIDPPTNTIAATARVGPAVCCLAVGDGSVWAANDTGIWRLSTEGHPVGTTRLSTEAGDIAYVDGALWVTTGGTVLRIDGQSGATRRYEVGHLLNGITVDRGRIAVGVYAKPTDLTAHLGPHVLRAAFSEIWFDVTDPAVSAQPGVGNWATEQQLQAATCARLLNHTGTRLVPEVAAAPPSVAPDGRTYTFKLRTDFRFSPPSGAPVTAETFRYSIERALSPNVGPGAPAVALARDIVGLRAYRARKTPHVAGIRAVGNTLTIALVRPAPDFPDRIAASYFCPVPIGTPIVPNGLPNPIPSAGPYYLTANEPGGIAVLRRNPNYRGPRARHLDAIVFRQDVPTTAIASRIAAGRHDYAAERGVTLGPDAALIGRHVFRTALLGTHELVFSRTGPTRDAQLRRAISRALDRRALARAMGDLVTDRYLPPGMPGRDARRALGSGTADARIASGLLGRLRPSLTVAVCSEPRCRAVGHIVAVNLRRIGVRVTLRRYPGDIDSRTSRRGADLVLAQILARYPDPVAFLRKATAAAGPHRRLEQLALVERRRRLAAANLLDVILARGATPAVAFGTPSIPELFSPRVGCQRFPRVSFGVDLGALCLRG